jgi:Calcineurin-like phosphoesterase
MIGSEKPWGDGEYAIAHLSDLHFGSKNYKDVWKLTAQFLWEIKPDLLLVTGDLVDTPRRKLYEEVREKLDSLHIPYHVCAGNHDRFWHGNQFPTWLKSGVRAVLVVLALGIGWWCWSSGWSSAWWVVLALLVAAGWGWTELLLWVLTTRILVDDQFADVFKGRILYHDELKMVTVPRHTADFVAGGAESAWTIGLFGDDSNERADASARGFIDPSHFLPIRTATEGPVSPERDRACFHALAGSGAAGWVRGRVISSRIVGRPSES